ncbi:membrane protein [Oikeobacillus pervagus]|uniref:Membrane protein n=1 Tax=Oikeobacillus pervagus TaxID=1325931 RepID=A0AAJ1T1B7_9BACI|nr:YihY/virulence factor BrkB family protein [Oikeobacillus pervagus]MDQ0216889.1 membrane protein [Oikeobacillus pervagus]
MASSKKEMWIFLKQLFLRIKDSDIVGVSAQMAFFFLLSLFPMLIFMVTLLPYLPFTQDDILNIVRDFAPTDSFKLIETTLNEVMGRRNTGLLSFGIIATIWSASNGMNAIIKGLNHAYDVKETRSFFINRSLSIVLTFALIFVIIIALLLQVFGKQIGLYMAYRFGFSETFLNVWNQLRWGVSPIILFIVFTGLYTLAPSKRIQCVTVLPGAVFAALGWICVSLVFSYYVNNFGNYTATYGSIGGVIILMIWFYLSAMMILIGGELNALKNEKEKDC